MDILATLVLSFDGEDFHLNASNRTVELTSPSVRSGLRALLSLDEHHQLFKISNTLDAALKRHGCTVYVRSGKINLAILGSKAWRGFMTALIYLGRLSRWVGAI